MAIVDSLEVDLARCLVQALPCFSSCAAMGHEGPGANPVPAICHHYCPGPLPSVLVLGVGGWVNFFPISCLTFFAEDFGLICWQKNVRACYNFRPANLVRFAWYNHLSCNFLIDTFQQSNQLEAGDGRFACIVAISQRFLPTINSRLSSKDDDWLFCILTCHGDMMFGLGPNRPGMRRITNCILRCRLPIHRSS